MVVCTCATIIINQIMGDPYVLCIQYVPFRRIVTQSYYIRYKYEIVKYQCTLCSSNICKILKLLWKNLWNGWLKSCTFPKKALSSFRKLFKKLRGSFPLETVDLVTFPEVILKVGPSPSKKNSFYLLQWKSFKNDEKCFLFHLKSSFRSQDI